MDFNVRPIARQCSVSGKAFQPGQTCWSVLIEKDGLIVRTDISAEEWTGPPANAIGHWCSKYNGSVEPERTLMDTESLYD